MALGRRMGNTVVMEGFNDTPQIGGLSFFLLTAGESPLQIYTIEGI